MVLKGELFFDPEDRIYNDHFPGNPIVPGTLIINALSRIINYGTFKIENFRYRNFLKPGLCSYKLEGDKGKWKCTVFDGDKTFATGTIIKD